MPKIEITHFYFFHENPYTDTHILMYKRTVKLNSINRVCIISNWANYAPIGNPNIYAQKEP